MPINIINTGLFARLRQDLGYYVDKTGFLEQFLQDPTDAGRFRDPSGATLFILPRRFGKTLFLSMLGEFFDITKDSRELFAGLKVSENEALCREWMNRYPVVFLSLQGIEGEDFAEAQEDFQERIIDVCSDYHYLLTSPKIRTADRKELAAISDMSAKDSQYQNSLSILSRALADYHGKPAIVLIDEYDVPLIKAWKRGYHEEMLDFMRGFFDALTASPSLKFAILAGCLRISWESLFSGLDHMDCFDITSSAYDVCGFTPQEVGRLLCDAGLQDRQDEIAEWYGGYRFGRRQDVCGPWSVMECVGDLNYDPAGKLDLHWNNTGTYELLREFVKRLPATEDVQRKMAALLDGQSIAVTINNTLTFSDVFDDVDNFWTLLYLTGYLALAGDPDLHAGEKEGLLAIPNREMHAVFRREVGSWFWNSVPKRQQQTLSAALWAQDARAFERQLAALLAESRCHDDAGERYCHGLLYTAFAMQYAGTSSGRESGPGRCGVVVPDRGHGRAAVLELCRADSPDQLEASVRKALDQMAERRCDTALRAEGYGTILHVGVAFCQERAGVAFREVRAGDGGDIALPAEGR